MHYVKDAEYWLVMAEVDQTVSFDEKDDEDGTIPCMGFSTVFGMVSKRILMMRM